jgi:hypothetical protein
MGAAKAISGFDMLPFVKSLTEFSSSLPDPQKTGSLYPCYPDAF